MKRTLTAACLALALAAAPAGAESSAADIYRTAMATAAEQAEPGTAEAHNDAQRTLLAAADTLSSMPGAPDEALAVLYSQAAFHEHQKGDPDYAASVTWTRRAAALWPDADVGPFWVNAAVAEFGVSDPFAALEYGRNAHRLMPESDAPRYIIVTAGYHAVVEGAKRHDGDAALLERAGILKEHVDHLVFVRGDDSPRLKLYAAYARLILAESAPDIQTRNELLHETVRLTAPLADISDWAAQMHDGAKQKLGE